MKELVTIKVGDTEQSVVGKLKYPYAIVKLFENHLQYTWKHNTSNGLMMVKIIFVDKQVVSVDYKLEEVKK